MEADQIEIIEEITNYECDFCEKRFDEKEFLLLHKKVVHEVEKTIHVKTENDSPIEDNSNDYAISEPNTSENVPSLISPQIGPENIEMEKIYQCDICKKKFLLRGYLNNHIAYVHKKKKKHVQELQNNHLMKQPDYSCEICEGKFRKSVELNDHKKARKHYKRLFLTCPKCDIFCNSIKQVKDHHFYKHELGCLICRKKFSSELKLKKHMKSKKHCTFCKSNSCRDCDIDYGKIDYQCFMCDRSFKTIKNLKLHKKEEHYNKSKNCKICGKSFNSEKYFDSHGCVINHFCASCDTSFETSKELKLHKEEKHFSMKQYPCKKCGMISYSKKEFLEHSSKKHISYSYFNDLCALCHSSFKTFEELKHHIQNAKNHSDFILIS